jgi:hypothetical protein
LPVFGRLDSYKKEQKNSLIVLAFLKDPGLATFSNSNHTPQYLPDSPFKESADSSRNSRKRFVLA